MELANRRLIDGAELAELCGVSRRTVDNWLSKGHGPKPIRLPGNRLIRFDTDQVSTWLNQQAQ
jgi:excisionase family DNA binding protein